MKFCVRAHGQLTEQIGEANDPSDEPNRKFWFGHNVVEN